MANLTGNSIGQYQLIEQTGETASSVLCKAFQPSLNRYVAIKILKPSSARRPDEAQRFRQQGDLLALFHHPRLVEVYEIGEANGLLFRAMRLAENGSLRDQLALGLQSPFHRSQRTLVLFQHIVEGLEQIHSQGLVYGNLTPSNILLDDKLGVLLNDFGLPARVSGTVSPFMAPEQVQGAVVDRRADVYALGVLLYTVLTGAEPPAGVVVSPRARRPELPEALDRVVFKSLAQNPDQRFQSVTEFFNALRAAFEQPQPAPQPVFTPPAAPPQTFTPAPAISQTVTVGSQKTGPGWFGIILGIIFVLILCLGAIYSYRILMENRSSAIDIPTQTAQVPGPLPPIIIFPTQPPPITQALPTQEPSPTDLLILEPTATDLPNEGPIETPDKQPEDLPQVEQPTTPPDQGTPGPGRLPCASAILVMAPFVVIADSWKRRWADK